VLTVAAACASGWLLCSAIASAAAPSTIINARPPEIGDGWRTASPASMGFDPQRLAAMTDAIRRQVYPNVHAVLIERDGRLVYEEYFVGKDRHWGEPHRLRTIVYDRTMAHTVQSVSKSVTSALVGIALANHPEALDKPVMDYFPEYRDLATPTRRAITLRQTLTMSTGLQWNEDMSYADPQNDEDRKENSKNPIRFILGRPVVAKPGTLFNYSGGDVQLAAEVVQRTTKQPFAEYAQNVLFGPLGITDWQWYGQLSETPDAASGLALRARDLAKFGSLYLHQGRWNGKQVIPAMWVRESTRNLIAVDAEMKGIATGYGYYWWTDRVPHRGKMLDVLAALGNGGQRILVLPALHLVVTTFAGRYNDSSSRTAMKQILVDRILPALEDGGQEPGNAG
jgi:CubicO group peptidase (beta-lactamase class C family)